MKIELTEAQALRTLDVCYVWEMCRGPHAHPEAVQDVAEIVRIIREELTKEGKE